MKYALIGCGRISKNHIKAAVASNLQIALCDIDPITIEKLKIEYSHLKILYFENFKDMLDVFQPELVAIATPNASHSQIAIDCIRQGVHVIIEKPLTLSKKDYSDLIEARNLSGVRVAVCHQNRFNKAIQKVKKTIVSGQLGKIHLISAKVFWYRDKQYYNKDHWRGSREHMDGALMNQSIHNIDLLLWLMNSNIKSVKSLRRNFGHPEIEMEDFGAALIEFENESIGLFEATTATYPKNLEESLYIIGEKGTIKIGGQSVNQIEEWRVDGETESIEEIKIKYSEKPENIYGYGHQSLYLDMIEAIEQNREPYVTLEEGYKAVDLILEIYDK